MICGLLHFVKKIFNTVFLLNSYNVFKSCLLTKFNSIYRVATLPGKTWKNLEYDNLGK